MKFPRPFGMALAILANQAQAHSFGQPYQLPMPYWMYIYGAMAALVLSFLVMVFVLRGEPLSAGPSQFVFQSRKRHGLIVLRCILQTAVAAAFLLAVITGLVGNQDSYRNFNMTFFWIVFAIGGCYLSAFIGCWYEIVNPWRNMALLLGRRWATFTRGRFAYPDTLAYWPALAQYAAFIMIELFGDTRPFSLSVLLLCYTALTLLGCYLFGASSWFLRADLFAVLFRLIGAIAPVQRDAGGHWRLQWPFAGLLSLRAEHVSMALFILFMLSSTAFDGLRETQFWFGLFWKDPFNLLTPLLGEHPIYAYPYLRPWFVAYEIGWLLLSPLLYLAVFVAFLWLGRRLTASSLSLSDWLARFTCSLLPIALVYHVTHYYTLVLSQGIKIRGLVSDPFGWGWNLFGNAITGRLPIIPDMGVVWDSQVWLILIGHVVSVWLAHVEALHCLKDRKSAALSQLPMLALMLLFTGFGLWILAQPLKG